MCVCASSKIFLKILLSNPNTAKRETEQKIHQPPQHITWKKPQLVSSERHSSAAQRASGEVCPQETGQVLLKAALQGGADSVKLSVLLRASCFIMRESSGGGRSSSDTAWGLKQACSSGGTCASLPPGPSGWLVDIR